MQFEFKNRSGNSLPAFGHTNNKADAIRRAKKEARAMVSHVDFNGGQYEVWSKDENENGFLIHASKCA